MRIVFVLDAYYPRYAAVEKCAKNVIDVFTREGHDVTVIAKRYWDSPSTPVEGMAEQVLFVSDRLASLRAKVDRRLAESPGSAWWHVADRVCAVVNYAHTLFGVSCAHRSLVGAYLSGLESLGFVPDQLVPCSSPFESVVACMEYASMHSGVRLTPMVFDQFADAGTLCKSTLSRRFKRGANLRLERRALEASNTFLNVTWEDHVRECHPGCLSKLVHIEHPLLVRPPLEPSLKSGEPAANGALRVVFAGSLCAGIRDPSPSLSIFEALPDSAGVELHMYVLGSGGALVEEAARRSPGRIFLHDAVPSEEVPPLFVGADCLLSIGNQASDQKPSKVAEYMSYGKPIVHVSCLDDDPVSSEVEAYPLGIVLREDEPVDEASARLGAFLGGVRGRSLAFDEVAALFPDEDPSAVAELLVGAGGVSMVLSRGDRCER